MIDATNVTTEFNTLFETITSLAEKVDPVKLNLTLSATAEALTASPVPTATAATAVGRVRGRAPPTHWLREAT